VVVVLLSYRFPQFFNILVFACGQALLQLGHCHVSALHPQVGLLVHVNIERVIALVDLLVQLVFLTRVVGDALASHIEFMGGRGNDLELVLEVVHLFFRLSRA